MSCCCAIAVTAHIGRLNNIGTCDYIVQCVNGNTIELYCTVFSSHTNGNIILLLT